MGKVNQMKHIPKIIIIHGMIMKLVWNCCQIVLGMVIDIDLVFYGLGDLWVTDTCVDTFYGHVTHPLLFVDKNYGIKAGATKASATRAAVRKVCGEKEVKIISYEYVL
eukprot:71330_1